MKANEQLRVDIEKWMESKDEQMGDIFKSWSDNYIQYHEKVIEINNAMYTHVLHVHYLKKCLHQFIALYQLFLVL